ncbi:MAG: hypothetical protein SFU98_14640 [Leptospiraceae bacterium]|nr:hypothetical protein [Leptospiraceae bacterium]
MSIKKLIILSTLLAFSFYCKPNAKSQLQYWENNAKAYTEAVNTYPNFKVLLEAKMKEATAIWTEAEKLTDEEAKASKMKEANDKLEDLLGQFTQIKSKTEGLLSSINKLDAKKLDKKKDAVRDDAVDSAEKTIAEIKQKLQSATPANEEEAKTITKDVISSLISAQGVVDRAAKAVKK